MASQELRILITGVGRRIELIQSLRQAALCLDIKLKIYGADMAGTAPALAYCDFTRKVCGMKESSYIDELLAICKADNIDLVLPTIDTDLLVLSQNRDRFTCAGVKVLISAPEMIAVCRDKNNTADFFNSCGLNAPKTYNNYSDYPGPYPCFIKPKDGSSSIDAYKAKDAAELKSLTHRVSDYVIQPFVEGTEYTVDIFCDFDGNPIYITPRIRLAVRAGEVLKTQISIDEKIIDECRAQIKVFKPAGPMTVQLIRDNTTGEDWYIEINPRFGGGAPLSMKAGAKASEALLRLLLGEKPVYTQPQIDGAVYSRFDQSVRIDEGNLSAIKGVIFDLDDTLYSEKDYVKSGYTAVADYLGNVAIKDELWHAFEEGLPAIDVVLEQHGLLGIKQECLDIYRSHAPQIKLYEGVVELIKTLKSQGIKVGIITDGRPAGQRNKIKALGLDDLIDGQDIIITDELGGIQFRKPCDIAFRIMQTRWKLPVEQIIYIGDNPTKDFQAPKQLGMQTLYFANKDGLYSNSSISSLQVRNFSDLARQFELMLSGLTSENECA